MLTSSVKWAPVSLTGKWYTIHVRFYSIHLPFEQFIQGSCLNVFPMFKFEDYKPSACVTSSYLLFSFIFSAHWLPKREDNSISRITEQHRVWSPARSIPRYRMWTVIYGRDQQTGCSVLTVRASRHSRMSRMILLPFHPTRWSSWCSTIKRICGWSRGKVAWVFSIRVRSAIKKRE